MHTWPRRAARSLCLALVLLASGQAAAAQDAGVLPPWLVGRWEIADAYFPDNLPSDERQEEMRVLRLLLDYRTGLTLHPTEIDYDTHITPGGAGNLVVQDETVPFSTVIGTGVARDYAGARLDLRSLKVSLSVRPRTCYMQSDRSDDSESNGCVAFLVARSSLPGHIFAYLFQGTPSNPVSKALWVFRRR